MANLFRGANHAVLYAKYRPTTPQVVIDRVIQYLGKNLKEPFKDAVDIGCGSGQSTRILAPYFRKITGTDISESQLSEAGGNQKNPPNVEYKVSTAEDLPFEDGSLQLITCSQSFHWFDQNRFFETVKRVLEPGGILALYGYWLPIIKGNSDEKSKNLERIITKFHDEDLGKYWDDRRNMLKQLYSGVEIPMNDFIREEKILVSKETTFDEYFGYIQSWSSYQELIKVEGQASAEALLDRVKKELLEELCVDKEHECGLKINVVIQYFLLMARK